MGKPFGSSGPAGWFKEALAPLWKASSSLSSTTTVSSDDVPGTVWSGQEAERAFFKGELKSKEAGSSLRVGFRNNSKLPLLLSWVAENGNCHHFYTLQPAQILEGPVTTHDHIENTNIGHSFCIAYAGDEEGHVRKEALLDHKFVVGGYRPTSIGCAENEDSKQYAHLVTISQEPVKKWMCCSPSSSSAHLRGASSSSEDIGNSFDGLQWVVHASTSAVDDKQIRTNKKIYEKTVLGGWPVFLEENWHNGDNTLEHRFAEDLECAAKCLPKHASEFLKRNTPVYVNKTFKYGPAACPISGRGLCFHPESKWLEENFMHLEKCECVEMYCAGEYLADCEYWGRAGVLVHEFSHAYHHKCLENGYDNEAIMKCYELAMKERLYDWVKVHGAQGSRMAKAYAATNCMEYFAELSAAFLGQPDMNSPEEFNKWYPFNRRQIKEHDPRAYEMLKKIWKV